MRSCCAWPGWAAAAGGLAGVVFSLVVGTVLLAVTIFYQVMVVTFFVPIVGGLYVKAMNSRAAAASIAAGLLGLLAAWLAITPAFRWADPVLVGLFAACVGAAARSFRLKPEATNSENCSFRLQPEGCGCRPRWALASGFQPEGCRRRSILETSGDAMPSRNIFDLTGKVAAVVGAGSGIGEAVAIGAARAGDASPVSM